jgi:sugar/nucleoside kinase (ribokinase family)
VSSLVVGSIALDTVETPFGRVERALGGTAVFFSLAASLFAEVQLVGVVGRDFPQSALDLLRAKGVDLEGLQRQDGETFRWVGSYDYDMNVAHTLDTRLNVFESFRPTLPEPYRNTDVVFLGNIDPELQLDVLEQVRQPKLVALDTMNFWIERKPEPLTEVVRQVDMVLINEAELREYTGIHNIHQAAQKVQDLGPRCVVIKRGEYGAVMFDGDDVFMAPAYPTWEVRDTTGAGDSFAGGFLGYLDAKRSFTPRDLRTALVYGTVIASFTVEDFSIQGLSRATPATLLERCARLADITHIDVPADQLQRISEGVSV